MRICQIVSVVENLFHNYSIPTIPKFANFWNFNSFPNWKNSENLLIFQIVKFWKFVDFPVWEIPKFYNLNHSENFYT